MLDVIEKLLSLQDRDRNIAQLNEELQRIPPERHKLTAQLSSAQSELEAKKQTVMHLESERKKLELEVEQKKQQIERYSLQQFQTKRNEEYRALTHEIEMCKEAITQIEDQELAIMEQIDAAQKQAAAITRELKESKQMVDSRLADLAAREQELGTQLKQLETGREELGQAVEESTRSRYERLMKNRGHNVVVGIERGVCGGCHMQLSRQIVVHCQAALEIITCPNCGRILYFTPDMDVAVVE